MTQQLVQSLSENNVDKDSSNPTLRRGSLVSKIVAGGSLESRSTRNSQTNRVGPPGLTGMFDQTRPSPHFEVLLERMVSLEEKFDQLILAVTGPMGPSERLGTVTSIGPYAQRNTNPG